jgi:hypothetical protein
MSSLSKTKVKSFLKGMYSQQRHKIIKNAISEISSKDFLRIPELRVAGKSSPKNISDALIKIRALKNEPFPKDSTRLEVEKEEQEVEKLNKQINRLYQRISSRDETFVDFKSALSDLKLKMDSLLDYHEKERVDKLTVRKKKLLKIEKLIHQFENKLIEASSRYRDDAVKDIKNKVDHLKKLHKHLSEDKIKVEKSTPIEEVKDYSKLEQNIEDFDFAGRRREKIAEDAHIKLKSDLKHLREKIELDLPDIIYTGDKEPDLPYPIPLSINVKKRSVPEIPLPDKKKISFFDKIIETIKKFFHMKS